MSNTFKKFMAALTSLFMALALVPATAFAGTITITPPDDTASTTENTYTVYKVFKASGNGTNISYKLLDGKKTTDDAWTNNNMGTYFTVDSAGNVTATDAAKDSTDPTQLSAAAVTAIAGYVKDAKLVGTNVTTTGTKASTLQNVDDGYYYITTTTGTAVTVSSANPNITAKDKNVLSTVDKVAGSNYTADAKNAIAAVGSNQAFTARVTKKHGASTITYNDTLTNMTFNNDVTVTDAQGNTVDSTNYTVTGNEGDRSFSVAFTQNYVESLADNATFDIHYTAKVTSDALQTSPATNSASLTLDNNNTTSSTPVKVYNGKITVNKTFTGANVASGQKAEFVLKNDSGKYYKIQNSVVSWVDSEDDATKVEFTTDGSGSFTGLADGTYTLSEVTVPDGFNKAADQTVTIAANTYTEANLSQSKDIENKAGTALPSTGGMGTVAFTVVGAGLVVAAGVLLVTRRRMQQ